MCSSTSASSARALRGRSCSSRRIGENASIQAALKAGVSAYVVAGIQAERLQPILDVAVARFEHEQALREELRDAQTKLVERKVIERAKGILMQQKGVSEEQAFRLLRKLAMDRNAKLLDVAQQVVDVAKLLELKRVRTCASLVQRTAIGARAMVQCSIATRRLTNRALQQLHASVQRVSVELTMA